MTLSKKKVFTKRPMVLMSSVRVPERDLALVREAARREQISQSEFFRRALRERARRLLMGEEIKYYGN